MMKEVVGKHLFLHINSFLIFFFFFSWNNLAYRSLEIKSLEIETSTSFCTDRQLPKTVKRVERSHSSMIQNIENPA